MDIQKKQARWRNERPLFEAEFIHSHFLPFFNFNENTGDYEIKSEYAEDEDAKTAYEAINTGWVMWLRAKRDSKASAVKNHHYETIVKSIIEHVDSHLSDRVDADLFDKGWTAAMKCIRHNIARLEEMQEKSNV